jgi:hypothetical protein
MSWLKVPLFGGVLKVKPPSQLRYVEIHHRVPMVNLGVLCISWWNHETVERENRNDTLIGRK